MTNQLYEAELGLRAPSRGRQNAVVRYIRPGEIRLPSAHRITDPRLIQKVRKANGTVKRSFDFAAAALLLVILAPVLLTIVALIKVLDPGPVFFGHRRLGRQGRRFNCLKFRTMKVNSQEQLQLILANDPHAANEWQEHQKLRNDPRVTKFGAFLRKTSLDELPQLLNVLRGDMSLVGPRPITPAELERYGRHRRYYLLVRPGITGLWQVNGRSSANYNSRVFFDRRYLESWNWLAEIRILLMTVPAVLRVDETS